MAITALTNMINPEVMGSMITAKLPKKIRFTPYAMIDRTLVGRAGDSITVPKFAYIGDAEDVAEGVAMGLTTLTASSTKATIKKAGKGVEITDEALLSGYGDPVGEAGNQITMSLASKVDNDCMTALKGATLIKDGSAAVISHAGIVDATDLFNEESDNPAAKVMFVAPAQLTTIRKDADFIDRSKSGSDVMITGAVGMLGGCQIIPTRKIVADSGVYTDFVVMTQNTDDVEDVPALTIYMKRDVNVETDRDIVKKTSVITADEHFVAVLSNESKVVAAKFKA
jgi:N4-gp56 family major capsid protein